MELNSRKRRWDVRKLLCSARCIVFILILVNLLTLRANVTLFTCHQDSYSFTQTSSDHLAFMTVSNKSDQADDLGRKYLMKEEEDREARMSCSLVPLSRKLINCLVNDIIPDTFLLLFGKVYSSLFLFVSYPFFLDLSTQPSVA